MTKQEFISELKRRLSGLSKEDLDKAAEYYGEAIDDCMEEGLSEEEAVAAVGPLEEAVRTILEEIPQASSPRISGKPMSEFSWFRQSGKKASAHDSTYEASKPFTGLKVSAGPCDVRLFPAKDQKVRIVHRQDLEGARCRVAVEKGILCIERQSPIKLPAVVRHTPALEIYLPQSRYDSLEVHTFSGDVHLPSDFTFGTLSVNTASGDVSVFSGVEGDAALETASGDMEIKKLQVRGSFRLKAASGDIEAKNLQVQGTFRTETSSGDIRFETVDAGEGLFCKSGSGDMTLIKLRTMDLTASASSGDVRLDTVSVKGKLALSTASGNMDLETCLAGSMKLHTASGDMELEDCDAESLHLDTVSGDIEGRLRTGKDFSAASASGSIRIPASTGGGKCILNTLSGDIRMTVG